MKHDLLAYNNKEPLLHPNEVDISGIGAILDGRVQLLEGSEDTVAIRVIQRILRALLFQLIEDGVYNSETERAVRVMQTSREVPVDGIVNSATLDAMLTALRSMHSPPVVVGPENDKVLFHPDEPVRGLYRHDRLPGRIALTFDDGPSPVYTRQVLCILSQARLNATFYIKGNRALTWPTIVQETVAMGHRIGNHSWSHPDFTSLNSCLQADEITRTQEFLQKLAGTAYTHTFRPPYGSPFHSTGLPYSQLWPSIGDVIKLSGCRLMMWQTDTWDWKHVSRPEVVVETFKRELSESGGGVVLMHDVCQQTVEALPGVLDVIRQRQLPIASDQELLASKYGTTKQPQQQ